MGSSLLALLLAWLHFQDSRPKLRILGDSCIGNYRLAHGNRLQDALGKKLPGWAVENWAEPGARPYDIWLQERKARLISGTPSLIVIVFSPDKFYGDSLDRFDEGGTNLRWLPWNRDGLRTLERLDPEELNEAIAAQFAVLAFGAGDAVREAYLTYVQWPRERQAMLDAGPLRSELIRLKTQELGRALQDTDPSNDSSFAHLPRARDMDQVLGFWKAEGIPVLVVLHPYGNPSLLYRTWSAKALERRDTVHALAVRWLAARPVRILDLNEPDKLRLFPDSAWDDHAHLKDPAAIRTIAELLAALVQAAEPPSVKKDRKQTWN